MRTYLLVGWLALPVAGLAYHYGPGQDRLKLDDVATIVLEARQAVLAEDWATGATRLDDALQLLPKDQADAARRLRLERARVQMFDKKLSTAIGDLEVLMKELDEDATSAADLRRSTRGALANAQFYMTWLMRLEGQPREIWEPEIEAARQNFRLLAEQSKKQAADGGRRNREDLESAIKLARLDIQELQGLPLPNQ